MVHRFAPVLLLTFGLAFLLPGGPRDVVELAIVVNRSTSIQALSMDQLRSIYLGEMSVWPDGKRVVPVAFGSGSPELRLLLKKICRMSEADYQRYYMQMSFEGKTVTQPRILGSSSAVHSFVLSNPGAIGMIRTNEMDSTVNVIKLNGAAPGDPAYRLSSR
jgi:ABC-type phosphate transport system substrate-binding protein